MVGNSLSQCGAESGQPGAALITGVVQWAIGLSVNPATVAIYDWRVCDFFAWNAGRGKTRVPILRREAFASHPGMRRFDSAAHCGRGGAGRFPDWKYEDAEVSLNRGTRLLLYTDGITEASGADGEEFEERKLTARLKAHRGSGAAELNSRVLAQVSGYCGGKFQDDATLLVVAVE